MKLRTHQIIRRTARPTALAAALLAAFGPAVAADDEISALTKPDSSVSAGIGLVTKENQRFGQYTGLVDNKTYGLLGIDLNKRDDVTGTWIKLTGRNLGLDSRELRFEHQRQGDWGYFVDYNETPRYSPYIINTAVGGTGTNSLTTGTTTSPKQDVELKTQRQAIGFGLDKFLGNGFDIQFRFKNEDKDGARLWGGEIGNNMAFMPEPIHYTTRQLEGTLSYIRDSLQLSGGYYGTDFVNRNARLDYTLSAGTNMLSPAPLPPSSQSHQWFLSGGYDFSKTTRATFKVSSTKALQNESFVVPAGQVLLTPGLSSLNGRVVTTLAQVGLTSRPLPKLSLLANLRYEDRADKTPERPFVTGNGINMTNTVFSRTTTTGKLEASYQLPMGYRATAGMDVNNTIRNVPDVRIIPYRHTNDETAYRLEMRKSMSETVNGSISAIHSKRTGSNYLNDWKGTAAYTTTLAPIIWADRDRDKLRLSFDWTPIDPLSLQFVIEDGRDKYNGLQLGPKKGDSQLYSLDTAYTFSEKLKGNAWMSRTDTKSEQLSLQVSAGAVTSTGAAIAANTGWAAQLRNTGDSIGIGLDGKPSEKIDWGAKFSYQNDRSNQHMTLATGAGLTQLPDSYYKLTRLQLFGKYALQKNSGVRLDLVHERRSTDDWTWNSFVYPQDGTTVRQDTNPKATFVGASYYHNFQ